MRAITSSTSMPERRAISSNGSHTKPSILSSETARIFALIGSSCSTGSMWINPPVDSSCPIIASALEGRIDSTALPLCFAAGENREKMAARTGQHEQMPNEMTVAQALVDEKEYTSGIDDTTGHQPEQCRKRNRQHHRANRNQRQPSCAKIKRHPQFRMARRSARRF